MLSVRMRVGVVVSDSLQAPRPPQARPEPRKSLLGGPGPQQQMGGELTCNCDIKHQHHSGSCY